MAGELLPAVPFLRWVAARAPAAVLALLALSAKPCSAADTELASALDLTRLSVEELFKLEVTSVTRQASTIARSPAAVAVITAEDIRRSGATAIPELLRNVPGVGVARIDNNKWAISSRGFSQRFFGKMLVQIDGRTLYNPFTSGVYWDAVDYPLEDIDRIEVIRGPRAGVWGANAVNGIVSIITKRAKDTQGGLLTGGGGVQEQGFATVRHGGTALAGAAYRAYGKGFDRDQQHAAGSDSHDAWAGGSAGFRIDWEPGGDGDLITVQGDYLRSNADRHDFRAQPAAPYSFENFETESTDNANVLGRWTRALGTDSGWALQLYWDTFRRFSSNLRVPFRWDTCDLDFQRYFPVGGRHSILWGAGYRLVASNLGDSERDNGFLFHMVEPRHRNQTFIGYVRDEITLVQDFLRLSLTSRFEHNDFSGFEIQPSMQLLLTPTEQQSLWASVARAVRTPNLNEFYANPRLLPVATNPPVFPRQVENPGLRSEEVLSYQVGYRVQVTSGLSLDTALFYSDYDDLVAVRPGAPQPGPSGFDLPIYQTNGLRAETYGAEFSGSWQALDNWRLSGGYTLLKMHLHRDPGLPASAEAAEEQSPQQQIHLQSFFDLTPDVEFDLSGRWVDRLRGFNPGGAPGVANEVPAYAALDARLGWRVTSSLEMSLVGQNLLDDHHPEFGTSPLVRAPLVGLRRGVHGKLAWRF